MLRGSKLTLVSITNTDIQSSPGKWKLKVVYRLNDGPSQEVVVPRWRISQFTLLRNLFLIDVHVLVYHETQVTGRGRKDARTWDDVVSDAMMAGYREAEVEVGCREAHVGLSLAAAEPPLLAAGLA